MRNKISTQKENSFCLARIRFLMPLCHHAIVITMANTLKNKMALNGPHTLWPFFTKLSVKLFFFSEKFSLLASTANDRSLSIRYSTQKTLPVLDFDFDRQLVSPKYQKWTLEEKARVTLCLFLPIWDNYLAPQCTLSSVQVFIYSGLKAAPRTR